MNPLIDINLKETTLDKAIGLLQQVSNTTLDTSNQLPNRLGVAVLFFLSMIVALNVIQSLVVFKPMLHTVLSVIAIQSLYLTKFINSKTFLGSYHGNFKTSMLSFDLGGLTQFMKDSLLNEYTV